MYVCMYVYVYYAPACVRDRCVPIVLVALPWRNYISTVPSGFPYVA